MGAGVRGKMRFCSEAKLGTDLGRAAVQTLRAAGAGVLLSQRKMLGSLTNVPEAAGQEN